MKKFFLVLSVAFSVSLSFAQGSYLEFKLTGINSGITGSMKMYSQDGNSRTEMHMDVPRVPGGAMDITTLYLKGQTGKIYMLDDKAKSYTEIALPGSAGSDNKEYEVTVLGKETINGYSSTHVKVKAKGSENEQEMWTSTGVTNYEKFKEVRSKFTNGGLFKALAAKGADGFPVRIKVVEHGQDLQLDLVKAEAKSNAAILFSLDGYTKSGGNTTGTQGSTGAPNTQEMLQKIQNMTPAERDAYIQQLKQQYGGNTPH